MGVPPETFRSMPRPISRQFSWRDDPLTKGEAYDMLMRGADVLSNALGPLKRIPGVTHATKVAFNGFKEAADSLKES